MNEPSTVADAAVLASQGPGFVLLALNEPNADELQEVAVRRGLWELIDAVIGEGERVVDLLGDQGERIEQSVLEGGLDQGEAIYLHRRRADHLTRSVHPVLPISRHAGAWRAR